MPVYLLDGSLAFPSPHLAAEQGLLAIGGDLSTDRLLLAYQHGIFPWFSEGDPIMWWSPDPRLVLYPKEIHIPRSLQKILNKKIFEITMDVAFDKVIRECADIRRQHDEGTWITQGMVDAYCRLHRIGVAHSIEAWLEGKLAGGLYGLSLGKGFFGESMFSRITNASKAAFVQLAKHLAALSFRMVDCQVPTRHLMQFGAKKIPRERFLQELRLCLSSKDGGFPDGSFINTPTPFFRDHRFK